MRRTSHLLFVLTLAAIAVPLIPFLLFGTRLDRIVGQWLDPLPSVPVMAGLEVAVLAADLLLPVPSSVVATLGGALGHSTGNLLRVAGHDCWSRGRLVAGSGRWWPSLVATAARGTHFSRATRTTFWAAVYRAHSAATAFCRGRGDFRGCCWHAAARFSARGCQRQSCDRFCVELFGSDGTFSRYGAIGIDLVAAAPCCRNVVSRATTLAIVTVGFIVATYFFQKPISGSRRE